MDVSAQYQRFSGEGVAAHDVRIVTKAKLQAFSICDGSCLAAVVLRLQSYARRPSTASLLRQLTSITPCESAFELHRPCRLRGRLLHDRRLHSAGHARLADPLDGRYFASHVSRTRAGIGALGCVRNAQKRDAHRCGERNFVCFGVVDPGFQTTERISLCFPARRRLTVRSDIRRPAHTLGAPRVGTIHSGF